MTHELRDALSSRTILRSSTRTRALQPVVERQGEQKTIFLEKPKTIRSRQHPPKTGRALTFPYGAFSRISATFPYSMSIRALQAWHLIAGRSPTTNMHDTEETSTPWRRWTLGSHEPSMMVELVPGLGTKKFTP